MDDSVFSSQFQAMRAIGRNPGVPQKHLARLTGHSEQACSTLVARLVARGFIERRISRRRVAVHDLTALGRIPLSGLDDHSKRWE